MKRILIFSGTTEGRELAEFLRNRQVDVIVSVATEYGRDCMDVESSSNVSVRTGRMDETHPQIPNQSLSRNSTETTLSCKPPQVLYTST